LYGVSLALIGQTASVLTFPFVADHHRVDGQKSAQRKGVNIMDTSLDVQMTGFFGSNPQVCEVSEQRVALFSVSVSRKTCAGEKQTLWVRVNC